jgi:hypothetical protein
MLRRRHTVYGFFAVVLVRSFHQLSSAGTGKLYPRHRGKKEGERAKVSSHTEKASIIQDTLYIIRLFCIAIFMEEKSYWVSLEIKQKMLLLTFLCLIQHSYSVQRMTFKSYIVSCIIKWNFLMQLPADVQCSIYTLQDGSYTVVACKQYQKSIFNAFARSCQLSYGILFADNLLPIKQCWTAGRRLRASLALIFVSKAKCGQHFTRHHLRWKINSETSCACPCRNCTVPEIINPVFAKTSPKRSFCMTENEPFGRACFRENWVYKFGHWEISVSEPCCTCLLFSCTSNLWWISVVHASRIFTIFGVYLCSHV